MRWSGLSADSEWKHSGMWEGYAMHVYFVFELGPFSRISRTSSTSSNREYMAQYLRSSPIAVCLGSIHGYPSWEPGKALIEKTLFFVSWTPTPGYLCGFGLLFWFCASADTRHSRLGWDCAAIQISRESTQDKVDSGRRTGTSGWLFINLNCVFWYLA